MFLKTVFKIDKILIIAEQKEPILIIIGKKRKPMNESSHGYHG